MNLQEKFDKASKVVQANILSLLEREQVGLAKYGCTVDRKDLALREWLQHAIEEQADNLNYMRRALHELDATEKKNSYGENTLSPNPPTPHLSNATELPYETLFLLNLKEFAKSVDYETFRATFRKFFDGDWGTAKVLANLLDNMEADRLLKTGDEPTPDFMLKMVGEVTKNVEAPHAIQRMFEACGVPVKFVNVTDMAEFRGANEKAKTGEPKQ